MRLFLIFFLYLPSSMICKSISWFHFILRLFLLQSYKRYCWISEIEIAIFFEQSRIFAFCKKECFKLIEIFKNNLTSIFDPWTPFYLKSIGGWGYLKDLLSGGIEAFYRMSKLIFVQKLSYFKVCNFGRISYK